MLSLPKKLINGVSTATIFVIASACFAQTGTGPDQDPAPPKGGPTRTVPPKTTTGPTRTPTQSGTNAPSRASTQSGTTAPSSTTTPPRTTTPSRWFVSAGARPVEVRLNGEKIVFDKQGAVEDRGRVLVPLRSVIDGLGGFCEYNRETRTVTGVRGATTIQVPLDQFTAFVNGEEKDLETPARSQGGTILVPLRFIAESLGANVRYDKDTRIVDIEAARVDPDVQQFGDGSAPQDLSGVVVANYNDLSPQRFVLRVAPPEDTPEAPGKESTIRIAKDVRAYVRRNQEDIPFDVSKLTRGDQVSVRLKPDGSAGTIVVKGVDEPDGRVPLPPSGQRPRTPADPLDPRGGDTNVLRGELVRLERTGADELELTLSGNRTVRASLSVLVLYEGKQIRVTTLQPNDKLLISRDAQTGMATRIQVIGVF